MTLIRKKSQAIIIVFSLIFVVGLGLFAIYGYPIYEFTNKSDYSASFTINSYPNDILGTIYLEKGSYSTFIRDSFTKGSSWSFTILFSDIDTKNSTFYLSGTNTDGMLMYGSGGSDVITTNLRYNELVVVPQDSIYKVQILNKTLNDDYTLLIGLKKGDFSNSIIIGGLGFFIVFFTLIITSYGIIPFYCFYVLIKKRANKNSLRKQYQISEINTTNFNEKYTDNYCSFCGNRIDETSDLYCSECGEKLTKDRPDF